MLFRSKYLKETIIPKTIIEIVKREKTIVLGKLIKQVRNKTRRDKSEIRDVIMILASKGEVKIHRAQKKRLEVCIP